MVGMARAREQSERIDRCEPARRWSLIVAGDLIAVLAAWRSWHPDERVPRPLVPAAVVILGLYTIAAPLVFGNGVGDFVGISLVILGLVFVIFPAPEALWTMQ